jgi:fibronectin-binding autotransporter adhesin
MKTFALICAAVTTIIPVLNCFAGTHIWTGGTSGLWSVPSNWEANSPPFANESPLHLVFPTNAARRLSTNNIPNLTINSISLAGAAYTLAANSSATNIVFDSSEGNSWWNIRVLGGTGHRLVSSFRAELEGNLEVMVAAGGSVEIDTQLAAATANSGLSKDGPGTLILAPISANTYDGVTTIRDGTLRLEGGFFFGGFIPVVTVPRQLVIGNASPTVSAQCLVWEANQIADTSAVTINDNGELLLADVNETVGSLEFIGGLVDTGNGILTLNGDVTAFAPAGPGAAGQIHGELHLGMLSRAFTTGTNAELYVYAQVSGGNFGNAYAGVTKYGPGTLVLQANNTYDGYTFVNGGTLATPSAQGLGSTNRPTSVGSNATLRLTGVGTGPTIVGEKLDLYDGSKLSATLDSEWVSPITLAGDATFEAQGSNTTLTISGVIDGSGSFTKTGPGEVIMAGLENNTFGGSTIVKQGLVTLLQGTFFSNRVAVPGPLIIGATGANTAIVEVARSESIAGSPVIVNEGGKLLINNLITETITSLSVNNGEVDTGLSGYLQLFGDLLCTNDFPGGVIRGRIDFGNSPRTIRLVDRDLSIPATIYGGPNAALHINTDDSANLRFQGSNTYSGLTIVKEGTLMISDSHALGSTNAGTVVSNFATLFISGPFTNRFVRITNEVLNLHSKGNVQGQESLVSGSGTNIWSAPVFIDNVTEIAVFAPNSLLTIAGPISGPGTLKKSGEGELRLAGAGPGMDNTYTGTTRITGGTLTLAKAAGAFRSIAIPNDVSVGEGGGFFEGTLHLAASHQLKTNCLMTLDVAGQLQCGAWATNSVGKITGYGGIDFQPGALLRLGFTDEHMGIAGQITGGDLAAPNAVCLEKYGFGTLTLWRTNILVGSVDIKAGGLYVGSYLSNSITYVRAGTLLTGDGRYGAVHVDGGKFWVASPPTTVRAKSLTGGIPGTNAPGTLRVDSGSCLEVDTAPDVENLKLEFVSPPQVAIGEQFLVVSNRSAGAVIGKFNHLTAGTNLVEGAKFFSGTNRFTISYVGGNGNDVVITRVANPMPAQIQGISPDPDGMLLNVSGEVGLTYRVEAAFDLGGTNEWTTIGSVTLNQSGFANFIDGAGQIYPRRFYRFVTP